MKDSVESLAAFFVGVCVAAILFCALMAATSTLRYEGQAKTFLTQVAPDYNADSLFTCLTEGETLGVRCSIVVEGPLQEADK